MNWIIRSRRRAPTALRTPTSTARRVARAVIKVTKLIAAMITIRAPTVATPASTRRSPGGLTSSDWLVPEDEKWMSLRGVSRKR